MLYTPDHMQQQKGAFSFTQHTVARAGTPLCNNAIKELWHGFTCRLGSIELQQTDQLLFEIGEEKAPEKGDALYAIRITPRGVALVSDSAEGLLCGFMTLIDRIETVTTADTVTFQLPCCEIKETPLIKNRMLHYCIFAQTELFEVQKFLRMAAALKYSHVVLEFWGSVQYDALKEMAWPQHSFTKAELAPIFEEARCLGLELIPMFNHWGHASAGRAKHGKHVVLDQNPALQPLFSPDGWTWELRNPSVRALHREIRRELIELCGAGGYFHLGCDEAYNFVWSRENVDILIDYLNENTAELLAAGRRPILWADMLLFQHEAYPKVTGNRYSCRCPSPEMENYLLNRLDKRILLADWQYNTEVAPIMTAQRLKNAGFDVLLCPWDRSGKNVDACCDTALDEKLFGIMHTTWHTLSTGMPQVTHAALRCWESPKTVQTHTAAMLRRVYFAQGDYEMSGWSRDEIGTDTN